MLKVCLTGGIATGKTYCLRRFAGHGAPVVDADRLARDAVAPGSAALGAIVARFGRAMLEPDGALDRRRLAAVVFADPGARRDLEAIVHPVVYRMIAEWFAGLEADGRRLGIADIPLLFETGHAGEFDRVVVAACPPDAAGPPPDRPRRPGRGGGPPAGSRPSGPSRRSGAPRTSSSTRAARPPRPTRAWTRSGPPFRRSPDHPPAAEAAASVFLSSSAIVIGPTPPGTGVSAPATSATSGCTSPTTSEPRFSKVARRGEPGP